MTRQGASTAHDLPPVERPKRQAGDWYRSIPRCALEHHFATGQLAVRHRLRNFQRVYDLPERIIDEPYRSTSVDKADAERELLRKASVSLGLGTAHDLADYCRMPVRDAEPRLQELVEEGADLLKTAEILATELQSLAGWLGLERVWVRKSSAFGKALAVYF